MQGEGSQGLFVGGKVAVVTGAGGGLGRALALALADRGCHVLVSDVEYEAARAVSDEISRKGVKSLAARTDVSRYEDVAELATLAWKYFGHVDLLFNNAGVYLTGALDEADPQDAAWLLSVNIGGVFNGIRAFAPRFAEQGTPAWICNTGSEHSLGVPNAFNGLYTATKHAVLALSDVLRREMPAHVGVSILCPGIIATGLWNSARNRPQHLGGSAGGDVLTKRFIDRGMAPADVANRAIEGIERGDFYIVTHPHDRQYAAARSEEVLAAFDAQAPWYEGAEQYDALNLAQALLPEAGPQELSHATDLETRNA